MVSILWYYFKNNEINTASIFMMQFFFLFGEKVKKNHLYSTSLIVHIFCCKNDPKKLKFIH